MSYQWVCVLGVAYNRRPFLSGHALASVNSYPLTRNTQLKRWIVHTSETGKADQKVYADQLTFREILAACCRSDILLIRINNLRDIAKANLVSPGKIFTNSPCFAGNNRLYSPVLPHEGGNHEDYAYGNKANSLSIFACENTFSSPRSARVELRSSNDTAIREASPRPNRID